VSVSGRSVLAAAVGAAVLAAVAAGLILLGPPSEERGRKLDDQRIAELRAVAGAIDRYWIRHDSLPPSLEALANERDVSVSLQDPETRQPYEYRPLDDGTYELCADFAQDSSDDEQPPVGDRDSDAAYPGFWSHGAGRHCFRLEPQEPV
jgi:hypothetical protein